MKALLGVVLVGAAVLSGLSFSQKPDTRDPTERKLDVLEQDLISTRQKVEETATQLAETRAALLRTLRYLDLQSKSAAAMSATLEESEKAGFTYGINPESRQLLLRGWREQLSALQKDVPSMPEPKPAAKGGAAPAPASGSTDKR